MVFCFLPDPSSPLKINNNLALAALVFYFSPKQQQQQLSCPVALNAVGFAFCHAQIVSKDQQQPPSPSTG